MPHLLHLSDTKLKSRNTSTGPIYHFQLDIPHLIIYNMNRPQDPPTKNPKPSIRSQIKNFFRFGPPQPERPIRRPTMPHVSNVNTTEERPTPAQPQSQDDKGNCKCNIKNADKNSCQAVDRTAQLISKYIDNAHKASAAEAQQKKVQSFVPQHAAATYLRTTTTRSMDPASDTTRMEGLGGDGEGSVENLIPVATHC